MFEEDVPLVVIILIIETIPACVCLLSSGWASLISSSSSTVSLHVTLIIPPALHPVSNQLPIVISYLSLLYPLIPTAFAVTIGLAAQRLRSKRISCLSPDHLLVTAKVETAFFDKTGTLTNQGMDFHFTWTIDGETKLREKVYRIGMALSHALSSTRNGKVVGTHIDMAAFESTRASMVCTNEHQKQVNVSDETFVILKVFEFDNVRKTQTVIVEDNIGARYAFVKGSPDVIKSASASSTISTSPCRRPPPQRCTRSPLRLGSSLKPSISLR
jgi:magnesium-transporting ATPase (P-type)